jgi:hypothetical protein
VVRSAWYASAWIRWISEVFMTIVTFLLAGPDSEAAGRRVLGADPARRGRALVSSGAAVRTLNGAPAAAGGTLRVRQMSLPWVKRRA